MCSCNVDLTPFLIKIWDNVDLTPFLIKIWDATAGELKHLRRPKPPIEALVAGITDLKAKRYDINNRMAQLEREIPTSQVQQWLREVDELEDKAAATEHDFERRRCLCGWSWNCFSVNRRVAKRMEKIDKLMTQSDATPVSVKASAVVEIPISDSTFGMEAYEREILGYIDGPNAIEVIGIYGMGGVGKTTLLKSINNHRDVATKFDHVIWAVASKECKMEKLQKDIAKWLGLHLKQDDSTDDRAAELYAFLKNKDCLLLLDDLWKPVDLAMLGMVNASQEQGQAQQKHRVVVFTTRDKQVCDRMRAEKQMEIKPLKELDAWKLFMCYGNYDTVASDYGIRLIAQQLVQECNGHPLALVIMAKAMSGKSWEGYRALLKDSQMAKVIANKEDLLALKQRLKPSYDNLPDEGTKSGLLSCSMWPRGSIKKDELIECWMGLGLFDDRASIYDTYNKGYDYINTLKHQHLLEPGKDEREVKMHDLIREMALWLASDCEEKNFKWIVSAGVEASQAVEKEAWQEAERASLMYNNIKSLTNLPSTCPKLSVLLLRGNNNLEEIHGSHIEGMSALTYLDLEQTGIKEIPKEIGKLLQLQHLNLSSTPIIKLPAELGDLVNLKYLLLRHTSNLTVIAEGAISGLSSLKLLDLRGSGYEDCWDELNNLKESEKYIAIDIKTAAALQRFCSLSGVLIWRLNVITLGDLDNLNQLLNDIIKSRNTRKSMEQLRIVDVEMNVSLISEGYELECMKYLELCGLKQLEEIKWNRVQPKNVFPYLRELIISRCQRLRNVNWALQLQSLVVLDISFCDAMVELMSDRVVEEFKSEEELISDEGMSTSPNFAPRRIKLSKMPKLERISATPLRFPCCEEITVLSCPFLTELSFEKDSVERLKVIRCEQAWWDNLQWEDHKIKRKLSPLVKVSEESSVGC